MPSTAGDPTGTMGPMDAAEVDRVADAAVRALRPHTRRDWSAPAGPVTWSCRDTLVHVADDMFGYACQVAAEPEDDYPPFEITVAPETGPGGILDVVTAGAALLAAAVRTASPRARGWHPFGTSDAAGFAAMGVVELLVHTDDIARGLGVGWTPPPGAAAAALRRLWPEVEPGRDPDTTLLHVTGRAPLDGVPAPGQWRWDSSVR